MGIEDLIKDEREEFDLGDLGVAVNKLIEKQEQIAVMEEAIKQAKAEERNMSQVLIPEIMDNIGSGVSKITLTDGRVIECKDAVQCSITAANRSKAYSWMDDHGHGDLIKFNLVAKFQRGEKDMAEEAQDALDDIGVDSSIDESVHPGTLKAWARKELEAGRALPEDLFNVHVVRITSVK